MSSMKVESDYRYDHGGIVTITDDSLHEDCPYPLTGNDLVHKTITYFDIQRSAELSGRFKSVSIWGMRFYTSIAIRKFIKMLEKAADLMEEAERKGYDVKKGAFK